MPYGSFSFNVVAGTDISTNVGFNPLGVIVSNYSPYYIYFPDGLTFCPPWTSSAVFPLAHATQARATWSQSPFGVQVVGAPPTGAVYTANITFSDSPDLVLSGGTTRNNPFNPAKIISGYGGNTAAGVHVLGTIPTGSVIRALTVSVGGTNVAGTAGILTLRLSDTIGGNIELVSLILISPSQDSMAVSYIDPVTITQLSQSVASWSVQIVQNDITNIGQLSWWASIVYN